MTVKDVFELRKQGKTEEAYEAIRPMYAAHKGKYTTLCMFWTASDILRKRIKETHYEESKKILTALLRILPAIEDTDGKAHSAVLSHAVKLADAHPAFSILDFMETFGAENLSDNDWRTRQSSMAADLSSQTETTPSPTDNRRNMVRPSTAQRILTRCFHEIKKHPDADHALKAMPLLQEAMRRNPHNKNNLRYMAATYRLMGDRDKAIAIYRQLLQRHRDSYLYAELAELTDEPGKKAALLCQAIQNQRQEKFRSPYRLALAHLLAGRDDAKAAHEMRIWLEHRQKNHYRIPSEHQALYDNLSQTTPTTEAQQRMFYRKMAEKYPV